MIKENFYPTLSSNYFQVMWENKKEWKVDLPDLTKMRHKAILGLLGLLSQEFWFLNPVFGSGPHPK